MDHAEIFEQVLVDFNLFHNNRTLAIGLLPRLSAIGQLLWPMAMLDLYHAYLV